MFVCGAVACPDGSPVPCGSPAPTRTRWNALNCRRAWSATSEAMPLSVWADPVVMGGAPRCSAARGPARPWARREPGSSTRSACLTCAAYSATDRCWPRFLAAHAGAPCVPPRHSQIAEPGTCTRETVDLKADDIPPRGDLISLQVDGDSIAAKPWGARSAASAIAPAAGAGVALMRPGAIGAISPPTVRPLPRDCLLRLFADPDDNTTKRTIS
jgi:hypothetical protein